MQHLCLTQWYTSNSRDGHIRRPWVRSTDVSKSVSEKKDSNSDAIVGIVLSPPHVDSRKIVTLASSGSRITVTKSAHTRASWLQLELFPKHSI